MWMTGCCIYASQDRVCPARIHPLRADSSKTTCRTSSADTESDSTPLPMTKMSPRWCTSLHDAPARHAALNLTMIRHWRERRRATIQITTMMMMTSIQITNPLPWPMQTRISRTTTTTTTHPQKAMTMTHQRTTMAQMRSTMPTSTSNPLVMQEWTTTLSMARVLQELMRMSQ